MGNHNLIARLVNIAVGIIVTILGLRVLLRLLNANPNVDFVLWIYNTSQPLLSPFQRIFPSPEIGSGFVLEFSAIFAIIVYIITGWILLEIVGLIFHIRRPNRPEKDRE